MEDQIQEQRAINNKKPNFSILAIIAIIAVLGFAAYKIFGKKMNQKYQNTGTATISWNANTEPDLAGYKIYFGSATRTSDCPPGGYPEKIDVGKTEITDKPGYKIENLAKGKTYYFSVTSYDTSGNESCFSPEMRKSFN